MGDSKEFYQFIANSTGCLDDDTKQYIENKCNGRVIIETNKHRINSDKANDIWENQLDNGTFDIDELLSLDKPNIATLIQEIEDYFCGLDNMLDDFKKNKELLSDFNEYLKAINYSDLPKGTEISDPTAQTVEKLEKTKKNFSNQIKDIDTKSSELLSKKNEIENFLRSNLDDRQYNILELYHGKKFTQIEIAEHFKKDDRTVRRWLTEIYLKLLKAKKNIKCP